jgi:hypothetical protein
MRFFAVLLALTLACVVASCWPEEETTASIGKCATDPTYSFNPRVLEQCVAACRKCDHGTTTTCTTSCTLKGAR